MAFDAFTLKNPVYPEAIQARLLDRNDPEALPGTGLSLTPQICKPANSAGMSPPPTTNLDIFSPVPGDSDVTSHFERDSSNETKIAARSVRTAAKDTGRVGGKLHAGLHQG